MKDCGKELYVQYGCGLVSPAGWVNFDTSPTLRLQKLPLIGFVFRQLPVAKFPKTVRYGDIVKGLPLQAESCRGIHCSHVLEHLSLEDLRTALRNTYKVLAKGGIFRFVLPDLEALIKNYLNCSAPDACSQFIVGCHLGKKSRNRGFVGFLRQWLGNSQHLWMWDFKGLEQELAAAGFKKIQRVNYGDSKDKRFLEAELEDRWINSMGIECVKE